MKRLVVYRLLALVFGIVAVNGVFGDDRVERRDRKADKGTIISGKIVEEKVDGIKMKVGNKEEVIPSAEIIRVSYEDLPTAAKITDNNLFLNEEKEKDLTKTVRQYQDLAEKAKGPALRYYKYRAAALQAAAADTDAQRDAAAKSLQSFIDVEGSSWEYPLAARTLGRLYVSRGEYDAALKVFEPLSNTKGAPADIKSEAENALIDVMFQANKIDQVKAKINAALSSPMTPAAQKARYNVYLIGLDFRAPGSKVEIDEVVKKLDEIIARPGTDTSIKALAYNVMGDCYQAKNRIRDAMYAYLRVDVIYSQDRGEHLKALNKLLKIFEDERDLDKVQIIKEKIARFK